MGKIVDRLLHKPLLIGLTSIGNNDGDEIEGDQDEAVTDEEGIVDDAEEIVTSDGVFVD